MQNDWQELRYYARDHSEEAFTRLVNQHLGMVYSSALRRTGDEHLARDITQIVFTNLVRRAASLQPLEPLLAGSTAIPNSPPCNSSEPTGAA